MISPTNELVMVSAVSTRSEGPRREHTAGVQIFSRTRLLIVSLNPWGLVGGVEATSVQGQATFALVILGCQQAHQRYSTMT